MSIDAIQRILSKNEKKKEFFKYLFKYARALKVHDGGRFYLPFMPAAQSQVGRQ